ncbi:MAG: HDOD domain-containing protein [Sulfurimonas sp.]|nr:HDOD domain-containing protein [Sulfurimonas sp.]
MHNILIPESFPNLPSALRKLQEMFVLDEIDSQLLVKLLEDDPLLCANILKLVNSPHYGLSRKVASVHQAVMLLGATIIRGIVMAAVLKKSFPLDISPYHISIDTFDTICALRVRLLTLWLKDEVADIANLASAAFLMEAGKIVTSNAIIQNNLQGSFSTSLESMSIEQAEEKLFGAHSYTVAAKLFQQWEFEENFIDLIAHITQPKTKEQQILHILCKLINTQSILGDEAIEEVFGMLISNNMSCEKLKNTIETIQKEQI